MTGDSSMDTGELITLLIAKDSKTKAHFACQVRAKGSRDEHVLKSLLKFIGDLGHTKIILKGDGEPALVELMEAVKGKRDHETRIRNPPAYDPQANRKLTAPLKEQCKKSKISCA